jgi:hypothetical protein
MRKTSLSVAERHIIASMLSAEYGPASGLSRQLMVARVEQRRLTGVGVFVDLAVPPTAFTVDRINTELSAGHRTSFPAPRDLVGLTLFIRDGTMSFLEGYTYGDGAWPDEPMEDWLIFDPVEARHQKAK